jgi:hypothetical protein
MGGVVKAIGGIFGVKAPSAPAMPPPPPPAPKVDDAAVQAAADEEARLRAGKGRASTILTALANEEDEQNQNKKRTLLGQ